MQFESEDEEASAVDGFCPGMDAAVNCNLALINTAKAVPQYDTAGLHRSRDPGAGAISPYHNGTTFTAASIPAGGELFKFYGDDWFEGREHSFGLVPLSADYPLAQEILESFGRLDLSEKGKRAIWKITKSLPWESRTSNAFPDTYEDAIQASEHGIGSLYQPSAIRSIQYLEKHGRCMDGIRPGPSTVVGAGRGAFATRFFQEGTIITGSPLLHVPFRDFVDMHGTYYDEEADQMKRDASAIVGQQILLNYCFGHKESTLLLCPYGAGVSYINHDASRANVKLQWTPDGIVSQNDAMFTMSVSDMEWNSKINLAFDFVATKDIMPGEELFLDYGSEWEEAWNAHVRDWEPPLGSEDYAPAIVWDERLKGKMLRTQLEQEIEPYPPNLRIRCHSEILEEEERDWSKDWEKEERGIDCNILHRGIENGEFTYDVELPNEIVDEEPKRLTGVPRGVFKFVDRPYTTDNHLENAFRHELMIPNDLFPDNWKNII